MEDNYELSGKFFGWVPESHCVNALGTWLNSDVTINDETETLEKPLVRDWSEFRNEVARMKDVRDTMREQGYTFDPWKIAKYLGVDFPNPNQGNLGSCASFGAKNAVAAKLLIQIADGYKMNFTEFNPYPTWRIGKSDAGYRGAGATLSMMLSAINNHGMFPVSLVGKYEETVARRFSVTEAQLVETEKYQVGACYLGELQGKELARAIFDCAAAGFPVAIGTSIALGQNVKYIGHVKTSTLSGGWMHATAIVGYRNDPQAGECVAHQNSWGEYWPVGPEGEPASIVWDTWDKFVEQCNGSYTDAFAITRVESPFTEEWGFAPIKIGA